jgi:hypothetical protein
MNSAKVNVVLFKVTDNVVLGAANGAPALLVLLGLWLLFPFWHSA